MADTLGGEQTSDFSMLSAASPNDCTLYASVCGGGVDLYYSEFYIGFNKFHFI